MVAEVLYPDPSARERIVTGFQSVPENHRLPQLLAPSRKLRND